MKIFLTLYRFELKKLLQKRFAILVLAGIYAFVIFGICSNNMGAVYVNDTPYMRSSALLKVDIENERALSGRKIDTNLLKEVVESYRRFQELEDSFGDSPSEEQKLELADAHMEMNRPYSAVWDYCRKALNVKYEYKELLQWEGNEEEFYALCLKNLQTGFEGARLTKGEIAYWEKKYAQCERPLTFCYCGGYKNLLSLIYGCCVMLMFYVSIALSGIFSEERILKCDQLILCAKNGQRRLYFAKIAAGLTLAAAAAAGLVILALAMEFWFYGTYGFEASLQLSRPLYPYPIAIGWFVMIVLGILFVVIMLVGLMVMFLSVCFSRSAIPMSVMIGCIIAGLFLNVPGRLRVLSQVWDWLPVNYLFAGNIYDLRLLPIGGRYLVSWQALPVLYALLGVGIVRLGSRIYERRRTE